MGNTTVRMFGQLRAVRERAGLPHVACIDLPPQGLSANRIAQGLGLPSAAIEGVFVNHRVHSLDHWVMPGDAVAFVPPGTPGPHRVFLGLYAAGKSRAGQDESGDAEAVR